MWPVVRRWTAPSHVPLPALSAAATVLPLARASSPAEPRPPCANACQQQQAGAQGRHYKDHVWLYKEDEENGRPKRNLVCPATQEKYHRQCSLMVTQHREDVYLSQERIRPKSASPRRRSVQRTPHSEKNSLLPADTTCLPICNERTGALLGQHGPVHCQLGRN